MLTTPSSTALLTIEIIVSQVFIASSLRFTGEKVFETDLSDRLSFCGVFSLFLK